MPNAAKGDCTTGDVGQEMREGPGGHRGSRKLLRVRLRRKARAANACRETAWKNRVFQPREQAQPAASQFTSTVIQQRCDKVVTIASHSTIYVLSLSRVALNVAF